ncbi:hypothetical protein IWQ62_004368 [Dispira parvispora]|uniref:GATA-type domain-containing protein n=1 Tax=Dispira parvispora TaxID=1520584 RepID=A0A9W8E0R0_9FUNG|nr:hypothetical protein IWQ62_004368 [Dispira parvispora]
MPWGESLPTANTATSLTSKVTHQYALDNLDKCQSLGECSLVIGPHMFPNTRFYVAPAKPGKAAAVRKSRGSNKRQSTTPPTVVFEFTENPGALWVFPPDAVIEPTTMTAPFEVLVSFCLPSKMASPQPLIMQISQVNDALLDHLQRAVATNSALVQALTQKSEASDASSEIPLDYFLPCELPSTLLDDPEFHKYIHTLTTTSSHVETPSLTPSHFPVAGASATETAEASTLKRHIDAAESISQGASRATAEFGDEAPKVTKRVKSYYEGPDTTPSPKKSGGKTGSTKRAPGTGSYNNNPGGTKKCQYCGCKTTPMWRRGPAGPGTLCNACGVKWKHGKILQGVTSEDMAQMVAEQAQQVTDGDEDKSSKPVSQNATPKGKPGKSTGTTKTGARKSVSASQNKSPGSGTTGKRATKATNPVDPPSGQPPMDPAMVSIKDESSETDASLPPPVENHQAGKGTAKTSPKSTKRRRVVSPAKTGHTVDTPSKTSAPLNLVQVSFGPHNATFKTPHCSMNLLEDQLQLSLCKPNYPDAQVSLYKETIVHTDWQTLNSLPDTSYALNVLQMQIKVTSYLTRFDVELLNPDRNEGTINFYFSTNRQFTTLNTLENYLREYLEVEN